MRVVHPDSGRRRWREAARVPDLARRACIGAENIGADIAAQGSCGVAGAFDGQIAFLGMPKAPRHMLIGSATYPWQHDRLPGFRIAMQNMRLVSQGRVVAAEWRTIRRRHVYVLRALGRRPEIPHGGRFAILVDDPNRFFRRPRTQCRRGAIRRSRAQRRRGAIRRSRAQCRRGRRRIVQHILLEQPVEVMGLSGRQFAAGLLVQLLPQGFPCWPAHAVWSPAGGGGLVRIWRHAQFREHIQHALTSET